MAEHDDFGSRTEAATPRRREEAREQGQVAFSAELITGCLILAGGLGLAYGAPALGNRLLLSVRLDFLGMNRTEMTPEIAKGLLGDLYGRGAAAIGFLLALLFATALAAGLGQAGVHFNLAALGFKWEKLSPFEGEPKLLSWDKGFRGLLALVKVASVIGIAYWALRGQIPSMGRLAEVPLSMGVGQAWSIVLALILAIAGALLAIGIADYAMQRWRFERGLRMSRQEIKEEFRRDEGDPLLKARVRRLQREAAQKMMFHEARKATVVVTNPTHLAIAIRYDRDGKGAPRVVAKGAGHVAKRIAALAREAGVTVLERKSLAQALYRSVKLNQEIPAGLYLAVAEVLAYVYRLRGFVPPSTAA